MRTIEVSCRSIVGIVGLLTAACSGSGFTVICDDNSCGNKVIIVRLRFGILLLAGAPSSMLSEVSVISRTEVDTLLMISARACAYTF